MRKKRSHFVILFVFRELTKKEVSPSPSTTMRQPRKPKITYEEFVKLDSEKRRKALEPNIGKDILEKRLRERKESEELSKKRVDTGLNIQRREGNRKRDQNLLDSILRQERPEPQGAEESEAVNELKNQSDLNESRRDEKKLEAGADNKKEVKFVEKINSDEDNAIEEVLSVNSN